jgi:hypothetical protein
MSSLTNASYSDFTVSLGGISIKYRYCPKWFGGLDKSDAYAHDHFEFLSLLVSETGYLSHFVNAGAVNAAGGHQAYAELFCKEAVGDKANVGQVDLFDCCF